MKSKAKKCCIRRKPDVLWSMQHAASCVLISRQLYNAGSNWRYKKTTLLERKRPINVLSWFACGVTITVYMSAKTGCGLLHITCNLWKICTLSGLLLELLVELELISTALFTASILAPAWRWQLPALWSAFADKPGNHFSFLRKQPATWKPSLDNCVVASLCNFQCRMYIFGYKALTESYMT